MNNFVNSGFFRTKILTQYKSESLNKHISRGWPLSPFVNHFIDLVPAQMRTGGGWYKGTADAVFQNLNLIRDEDPEYMCIFGGDHVYKMDVRQMFDYHVEKNAHLTISAIPIPVEEACEFGIIEVDENWKLLGFQEKPKENVKTIPGKPHLALASMGNYIFNTKELVKELEIDAEKEDSAHDFGKNIIPNMLDKGLDVYVYDFSTNTFPGMIEEERGYWRDVGSVDAYWQANMDLVQVKPEFNLYNRHWPLRTFNYNYPPAKFVWEEHGRIGMATNSLASEGCIISGGQISHCILSPNVRVNSFSYVSESIMMENVNIGRHSEIRKAIIDKSVEIPPYTRIGVDKEEDLARGFFVSPGGVTVVPKGSIL